MIRDFLTVSIVTLAFFGSAAEQEGDNAGLKLLAATGDVSRTLVRFLDLYAGRKAGAHDVTAGPEVELGGPGLDGWA